MTSLKLSLLVLLAGPSLGAYACQHPSLPNIPTDERIRGRVERQVKDAVLRYITEMSVYVACIQAEYQVASEGDAVVSQALLATRNNQAVAEFEAVRELYVANVGPLGGLFFDEERSGPPARMPMVWPTVPRIRVGLNGCLESEGEVLPGPDGTAESSACR